MTNYADDAGGNDPISLQTQWLYSNVRAGALAGYAHTNAKADLLQTAIWYFENELTISEWITSLRIISLTLRIQS